MGIIEYLMSKSLNEETKLAVWEKGMIIPGWDPTKFRKDSCNAVIEYSKYGVREHGNTGWEIDHINPVSSGGTEFIYNLQPLHWQNNVSKGENVLGNWSCAITSAV